MKRIMVVVGTMALAVTAATPAFAKQQSLISMAANMTYLPALASEDKIAEGFRELEKQNLDEADHVCYMRSPYVRTKAVKVSETSFKAISLKFESERSANPMHKLVSVLKFKCKQSDSE